MPYGARIFILGRRSHKFWFVQTFRPRESVVANVSDCWPEPRGGDFIRDLTQMLTRLRHEFVVRSWRKTANIIR